VMTMAAAMTATVDSTTGITIAFLRHHRRCGGVRVSTGSPYAVGRRNSNSGITRLVLD
jgi:hypothetical protein